MALLASFFLATFLLLVRLSVSLNQEGLYLLQAKKGLDDPSGALSNWILRDSTPCNWTGVECSVRGGGGNGSGSGELTVSSIDLYNFNLTGPFPSALCRLPNLRFLSLSYNYINSTLDDGAIAGCTALEHLDLSDNLLVGSLPDALAALPALEHLNLLGNNFSGAIPPSFGRFPRLRELSLVNNLLNSTVPAFLGNLSTLEHLNLSYNMFESGPIPAELGNLTSLKVLWLTSCNLVGEIPPSLGKLSMLTDLDLSINRLSGPIPEAIVTNLTSAVQIELYNNSLTGRFPVGLSRLPALLSLDASLNLLDGPLPEDIFDAPRLDNIHLYSNRFTGSIPAGISRSTTLTDVRLFGNQLSGPLPADLGKNSPLVHLDLSTNNLSGEIPASICDRGVLEELLLLDNSFSGGIPDGLGRCRTLVRLRLLNNGLSGEIPSGLWGLPHLNFLELKGNKLSGGISPAISGAANLLSLLLDDNQFSGSIPSEVGSLSNLEAFSAANNRLSGPLPASLGSLSALGRLVLRNNSISGELLRGIKSWQKLSELNLADNDLTGRIPPELGSLPVLNYLDLSGNILTGEIPTELQNLKLNSFNLSNNQLSGNLPPFFASEAFRDSFLGNPGLCGDLPGLCPVSQGEKKNHSFIWLLISIFLLAALILVLGVGWFCWRYQKFKKAKLRKNKLKCTLTSFHKIEFGEYEIIDCLDEDNLIGNGASGKVYKAVLSNGEIVAVKKLFGASKKGGENLEHAVGDAFEAEVATLGKVRHKNIVKLWCSCTYKDCKLLVYEYMPNGSLGDLLHSSKSGLLDWPTRYKIVLDAAEGLSYLHHDCVPAIVHRDIKSNNILLDGEYGARVADFGVAKAVEVVGKGHKSMSVIAGSCGYIAPEYAYTLRVNEKSDIYSFGVVILELVTGKPPIDSTYGEKDLVKWVSCIMEQKGIDHLIDPKLDLCYKEEIHKVLTIGLLCTSSLPINRPSMRRVVKMLQEVRKEDKMKAEKDGKLSPYYYEDSSDQGSIV